jgi:NAD(P)-dependent dehydrogenase (short-subunit alcohol dehydrogenase family)
VSRAARTILVTGAGGGLGGQTAQLFADRGWQVFAADLRPPAPGERLVPVTIDVTDSASVEQAAADIESQSADGLGAVVNFAGILDVSALMDISAARLQRIIDINVIGTHRVNQAFFGLIRRGHGRIVNISSETGWQRALMMNGPYAITKHAVEAYSDALRRELMFLDVPVIVIQPGPFRTDMTGGVESSFARAIDPASPFADLARKVGRLAAKEKGRAHDPAVLAEVVWKAVNTPRPRARYSVRPDLRRAVLHRLPVPLADSALRRMLR